MKLSRDIKIAATVIGIIICAIPVLWHFAESSGYISPGRTAFYRNTEKLIIGMHQSEVQEIFGEYPAYACRFSESDIWYYPAPGRLTQEISKDTLEQGTRYHNSADLPDPYAHIQLAFDSNETLIAHTFIGESYTTKWRDGSVKGTHFKHLPPGAL